MDALAGAVVTLLRGRERTEQGAGEQRGGGEEKKGRGIDEALRHVHEDEEKKAVSRVHRPVYVC